MDFLGCSDVCEAMNSSAVRFSHFVRAFCGDRREKDTAQSACAEGCFRAINIAISFLVPCTTELSIFLDFETRLPC